MSTHIMLAALRARDIPKDGALLRVVREWDLEGFDVKRCVVLGWQKPRGSRVRMFRIENATHFVAGYQLARTIGEMRKIIDNA